MAIDKMHIVHTRTINNYEQTYGIVFSHVTSNPEKNRISKHKTEILRRRRREHTNSQGSGLWPTSRDKNDQRFSN